jgi:hypothetical protein
MKRNYKHVLKSKAVSVLMAWYTFESMHRTTVLNAQAMSREDQSITLLTF